MARGKRSGGSTLSKHSLMELAAELHSRHGEVSELHSRREELIAELEQVDAVLATMGASGASRGRGPGRPAGSGHKRTARGTGPVAGRRSGGARRGKRGQGWAAIEAALKDSKGTGTSTSLKETWATLDSKTPLSVALASFVKSGKLKRKGEGRETVFSLA